MCPASGRTKRRSVRPGILVGGPAVPEVAGAAAGRPLLWAPLPWDLSPPPLLTGQAFPNVPWVEFFAGDHASFFLALFGGLIVW